MTKDFDLKFGYKNGFLADSEALCMCPCSFDFIFLNSKHSSEKLKNCSLIFRPLTFDLDIFPNTSKWDSSHQTIILGCVEALHQISASQVERKSKKSCFFEGQSFHILLKSYPILSIDQDLVSPSDKIFLLPLFERWSIFVGIIIVFGALRQEHRDCQQSHRQYRVK